MCYKAYSLKQTSIVMAAVGILFLFSDASADDFLPAPFHQNSGQATPGQLTSNSYDRLGFSPALSIEEKNQVYLDQGYSRLRFDHNYSTLGEIDYAQKPNAYKVLKLVMDEFEMFHGLRKVVDEAEAKFKEYTKKLKLKGEIVFSEKESTSLAMGRGTDLGRGSRMQKKRRIRPNFFYQIFTPDQIKWHFGLDLDDKSITGEINIGNYIKVEGSAGEKNDIFMTIQFRF